VILTASGHSACKLRRDGAHLGHRLDDVGAGPLGDLEGQGRLTVDPGKARGIVERPSHGRDIPEGHDSSTPDEDRHFHDVLEVLDQAWHGQDDPSHPGLDCTRRDEAVVPGDLPDQFVEGDVVGLEDGRIDQDLHELDPPPADVDLEHPRQPLDRRLQVLGETVQGPFGHRAGEDRRDDGKERRVDLRHSQVAGVCGQLPSDPVNRIADIAQRLLGVTARGELERDAGRAFGGEALHPLEPRDRAELLLHRFDQQAFGVGRTDPVDPCRDVEKGEWNLGIGFFRDGDVGIGADGEDHGQRQGDDTAARECAVDERVHGAVSCTCGRTVSPSLTKPCPTVIRRTVSGRPVTHMPSISARTISIG
jgi:hypothetical protein